MKIEIPDEVAQRLERVAQEQGLTVLDLLETMLAQYDEDRSFATLADMAKDAEQAGLGSPQPVDTAANSREILQAEYMNYLERRRAP